MYYAFTYVIIRLQVAIWKLSHFNDPDVSKTIKENGWATNHNEVLEPLRTMGDILPTNLVDILKHKNKDETDDDEQHSNDDTGWDSVTNTKKLTAISRVMRNSMTAYIIGSKL